MNFNSTEVYSALLGCTFSNPRTSKIQQTMSQKATSIGIYSIQGHDMGSWWGVTYIYICIHVQKHTKLNTLRYTYLHMIYSCVQTFICRPQHESGKRGTSQTHESGKRKARVRKKQGTSQEKEKHESGKSTTSQEKKSTSQEKEKHESGKSTTSHDKAPRVRKKKARVRKKQATIQEKEKLELGKRPSAGDSESRIHKQGFRN